MADVIKKTLNRFRKGLIMDFSPENTGNEVLTHALNATLLTFNGNELSLQNDLGNARVETAYLPEGYIPVGTCEYGGIIYIVSYNPLEDKSLIGCFPSPERNVSSDELGKSTTPISKTDFQEFIDGNICTGKIKNTSKLVLLKDDKLNPGDKFIVCSNSSIYEESLANLLVDSGSNTFKPVEDPIISLSIVSIEDNGKIVYLNSDVRKYKCDYSYTDNYGSHSNTYQYHILGKMNGDQPTTSDIDTYRDTLSSGYSVFKSKTSGKLAILAELIMIDSYSVTHSINPGINEGEFDIVIHTEVSPEIKDATDPKLKYYFLKKSQGYIEVATSKRQPGDELIYTDFYRRPLIYNNIINTSFLNTDLSEIYIKPEDSYKGMLDESTKQDSFLFPLPLTYCDAYKELNMVYSDVKLASIRIPTPLVKDKKDLLFKYDYTIVPCMNYGILDHLAVSNTIDFSNLHLFGNSDLTTWKYHIDGDLLKLTFGTDVYDTFETNKVDAVVLEFYDLWGFAGSLEITGKKSYSGIFTKVISLNALGALNSRKVSSSMNCYSEQYFRNINIQQRVENNDVKYYLNEKEVTYDIEDTGWMYIDSTKINDVVNDCGTLYANTIYGVKAYLRTVNKSVTEESAEYYKFHKIDKNLFLYTLPIYNQYYYTQNDYSVLSNPLLDLMLTYKLEDASTINVHLDSNVTNGYSNQHLSEITSYLSGNYLGSDLEVVKYYKFTGQSKLWLEVGLKLEYQEFNLSYDPKINELFSCKLDLIGDADSPLTLTNNTGEIENKEQVLNYENGWKFSDLNKLTINNDTSISIDTKFDTYNFITSNGTYIPINYEFVVGYKANIYDINESIIPATTVCALCHQRDGVYNYEDFNIYENNGLLYSSGIYFNSGDVNNSVFGIGRLISTAGTASVLFLEITSKYTETSKINTPGKLNTGEPLKQVKDYIGKLTFCLPHLHAIDDINGVNLHGSLSIPTGIGGGKEDGERKWPVGSTHADDTYGIIPTSTLFSSPKYNIVLNTKNSLLYFGEFVSTIKYYKVAYDNNTVAVKHGNTVKDVVDYNDVPYKGRTGNRDMVAFTGLTGELLVTFNTKLIETMKSVYAYNPDYNILNVKKGHVNIPLNLIKFNSNIISYDSSLDLSTISFNELIYMNGVKVSTYLLLLLQFSNIETDDPRVQFTPKYTYCGTANLKYLVTSLTYNTDTPNNLYNELSLQLDDSIVIKHHDGSLDIITGELNKKLLYGYKKDTKQLIQLDVSNYTIEDTGELTIPDKLINNYTVDVNFTPSDIKLLFSGHSITKKMNVGKEEVDISFSVFNWLTSYKYASDGDKDPTIFFLNDTLSLDSIGIFTIRITINNLNYVLVNKTLHIDKCFGIVVNIQRAEIDNLSFDDLSMLVLNGSNNITEKYKDINANDFSNICEVTYNNDINVKSTFTFNYAGVISDELPTFDKSSSLWSLNLNGVTLELQNEITLDNTSNDSIIYVATTTNYSSLNNYKYTVNSNFENSVLRGTSITLNDLVYEPSLEEHRLFVKLANYKFYEKYYPVLYYRAINPDEDNDKVNSSWNYKDTQYKNCLFLYTGPCFDPDTL